jgi:hypothetical protein
MDIGSSEGLVSNNGLYGYAPLSSSQMAMLFFGQLGQQVGQSISTTNNGSGGYDLFRNIQSGNYWSGTEWAGDVNDAWRFETSDDFQTSAGKLSDFYVLAVAPGEVGSPVPLPASAWLMLSALCGLSFAPHFEHRIRFSTSWSRASHPAILASVCGKTRRVCPHLHVSKICDSSFARR